MPKGQKSLGRSPPQELEVGPRRLLVGVLVHVEEGRAGEPEHLGRDPDPGHGGSHEADTVMADLG